jgi:hypothetical protein
MHYGQTKFMSSFLIPKLKHNCHVCWIPVTLSTVPLDCPKCVIARSPGMTYLVPQDKLTLPYRPLKLTIRTRNLALTRHKWWGDHAQLPWTVQGDHL